MPVKKAELHCAAAQIRFAAIPTANVFFETIEREARIYGDQQISKDIWNRAFRAPR